MTGITLLRKVPDKHTNDFVRHVQNTIILKITFNTALHHRELYIVLYLTSTRIIRAALCNQVDQQLTKLLKAKKPIM
jgi:hypothetical protein